MMSLRRNCFVVLAIVLLLIAPAVSARPYKAGPHIVDLSIRNATMQLIPNAKASVSFDNGTIRVWAFAKGYTGQKFSIAAGNSPSVFSRDVVLDDPDVWLQARNMINAPISSVYFNRDQYGAPANRYRISAFIPKDEWRNPTVGNLLVRGGALGTQIPFECTIELIDEFYRVDLLIARTALAPMEYRFTVFFKSAGEFSLPMRNLFCRDLAALSTSSDPAAESLALSLCRFIAACDGDHPDFASDEDPIILKRFKADRLRFDTLHAPTP
ncbi:MAG TPA: hypothetical protein PLU72_19815 [Candidatus Ozemobacteraceae bacterium]|nr:hypothetical protein [Candidatus Ozemobacteraceae bacterium]HQG28390.1 hypothetical protein [Candidatus Ozemobacteraceae bacterium]